eukprot:c15869_g1_i1 orf=240-1958(+)
MATISYSLSYCAAFHHHRHSRCPSYRLHHRSQPHHPCLQPSSTLLPSSCLTSERGFSSITISFNNNMSSPRVFTALQSSQHQPLTSTEERTEDDVERGYFEADSEVESLCKYAKKRGSTLFGVKLSPDIVAIAMVYFVQGVLGLSRLAVSFFLKDNLHLDPAETAIISGVSAAPWLIKPLYGFISDGLPLFGYRRRSYLVLCGLLGAVSWAVMAMFVDDKYGAAGAILLSSLSVAFSDVVVDSMAVERARGESQSLSGSIQSLCWGSSAAGGIVSAYFSGSLIEKYGVRFVFSVTALLPLLTSAVAVFVKEESSTQSTTATNVKENGVFAMARTTAIEHAKVQAFYLWKTIKEPAIFLPTVFIFLWQATPSSDTAMFFFSTNKLGFGPEFLGRVRLITSIASLAGVGLYNGFLKSVPLRIMFFWTTIIGCGLSLTQLLLVTGINKQLGISNEWFAMGDTLILTVLGQVSFMPILVLAARLCPPGVEATLFATLMSISNGGGVCGGLLGAWLTQFLGVTSQNFNNLAVLLIICNVTSLLPLPLLGLLPSEVDIDAIMANPDTQFNSNDEHKRS